MNVRPILFRPEMVRALLDGRKTQTRRVVRFTAAGNVKEPRGHRRWHRNDAAAVLACPFGQPGDLLWVRERWSIYAYSEPSAAAPLGDVSVPESRKELPRPSTLDPASTSVQYQDHPADEAVWYPSIHMPRWASRLTLRITEVRVERLTNISEADAIAEGIAHHSTSNGDGGDHNDYWRDYSKPDDWAEWPWLENPRASFRTLWNSTRAGTEHAWERNPWAWVVAFEVLRANIDQVLAEAA